MQDFLRELLQIPYYAYFKPSLLQNRLNQAAPQREGNNSFWRLSLDIVDTSEARRFLLQCSLWWSAGVLLFGIATQGSMPWWEMLFVSGGLLLGAWGIAWFDFSLGLSFPVLAGLVWGLHPDLWSLLQTGLLLWLQERVIVLLAVDLILSLIIGVGGAGLLMAHGYKRLATWFTALVMLVAFGIAILVAASLVVDLVDQKGAFSIAFGVVLGTVGLVALGVSLMIAASAVEAMAENRGRVVVAISIAGFMAVGIAVAVASGAALALAFTVAISVLGFVAGFVASITAGFVAILVAVMLGGGVARDQNALFEEGINLAIGGRFLFVGGAAGMMLRGIVDEEKALPKAFVAPFVVVLVVTTFAVVVVAVGVATTIAIGLTGIALPPPILALGLTFGLGISLSPRRSYRLGLVIACIVAALFFESQGSGVAGLALLLFSLGYFRIPLYPLALLTVATVRWSPFGIHRLLSRVPPFADEIVWLPLFGLDKLLVAAVEEDRERGEAAIWNVTTSFHQGWAALEALAQVTASDMAHYHVVNQIATASRELGWLPDDPTSSLRGVVEVRRRVAEIACQIDAALNATGAYSRLRRFNQAQVSVRDFRRALVVLKQRSARCFVPVVERWDYLIGEEIARLSSESEIAADIPNPYITGIPVQSDEIAMFASRSELVRAIETTLTTLHGKQTLALYGPRRMGKTTFLLHLPRLLPDELVPVFVDLQEAVQVSGMGGLYYNWAMAAHESARAQRGVDLVRPTLKHFTDEPAIAWREWLDSAENVLGTRKLFFTFDEFEWLVDVAEKNPVMEGAFSVLRNLSQHRPSVCLLFAGARRLEDLAPGGRWHDYFIGVRPLEVSYLGEPEARRLITNPIPDFPLDYAPGAVDEIIRLTRCQPMLVQLMGSIQVDWHNNPERRRQGDSLIATLDDVARAASDIIHEGKPYFANLWAEVSDEGQKVLGGVSQEAKGLTVAELAVQVNLPRDELAGLLGQLKQYQLIEQVEDRWRVQVELTRRAFVRFAQRS